jgi:hypothetical protein
MVWWRKVIMGVVLLFGLVIAWWSYGEPALVWWGKPLGAKIDDVGIWMLVVGGLLVVASVGIGLALWRSPHPPP